MAVLLHLLHNSNSLSWVGVIGMQCQGSRVRMQAVKWVMVIMSTGVDTVDMGVGGGEEEGEAGRSGSGGTMMR